MRDKWPNRSLFVLASIGWASVSNAFVILTYYSVVFAWCVLMCFLSFKFASGFADMLFMKKTKRGLVIAKPEEKEPTWDEIDAGSKPIED